MSHRTARLCDQFPGRHLQVAEPIFKSFGAKPSFEGYVTTLKTFEDHALLKDAVAESVTNRVLVVDGGGSHRCALLGSELIQSACENGWQGLVIYGCVRDVMDLASLPIGIRALHAHPFNSHARGGGDRDKLISFAGVNFRSGSYLYADEDGIIVCDEPLT